MSIRSQKSSNDDYNENLFERSYSAKSASEESLSCDDDYDNLSQELLKKLTPAVLTKLRKCFKKARQKRARDLDKKVEEVMRVAAAEEGIEFPPPAPASTDEECVFLNESSFVTAVDSILGNHKYTPHARTLYRALDRFQTGRVSWSQLVARLVASGARTTASRFDTWQPAKDGGIVKLDHCNRETLVTLVSIEWDQWFYYVGVSRGGRVGVYTGDMRLIKSYEVFYHRTGVRRRVRNCWITDAVYMSDVSCLVYSTSDRSLTIYDVSTITHTPLYCITGLPNIPTCLSYSPAIRPGAASELFLGTERGELTCIRFLQPRVSLLHVKTPDTINYYFWMELSSPPHNSYCTIRSWRAHSRAVRRVACERDGSVVLTCSHDGSVSVRLKYLAGTLDDYVVTVHRGVSCFHSVPSLRIFATGSKDGLVRLYTHTQSSPHATLSAGACAASSVVDVRILDTENVVVGYCSRCYIYIWDLYEECLLQTVKIKFPFLGVLGKKVEFGTNCIHLGPPRKRVQKEVTEDLNRSRRGSSVYAGSTGGLILQLEPEIESEQCSSYERTEILITCSDSVFTLKLRESHASVLPPATHAVEGRRPSVWDQIPLDTVTKAPMTPSPRMLTASPPLHIPPAMPYTQTHDLDQLIKNAGLENILEKNFVLMRGLKHDLNKKLFEMEYNVETRKSAVNACAPYLALARYDLEPLPTFDRLSERYASVKTYCPGPSVNVTPTGSESTTPRNKISFQ